MKFSNVLFSEIAQPVCKRFYKGPSVEGMLTICSNGSALLNKIAAMLILVYSKTHKNLLLQY